jgi:hypothetical protein
MEWLIAMLTALVGSVGCTFESNPKEEHPAVVEQQSAGTTAPKWVDFYADLDGVYPTASAPNRTSAVIVRNHSTENDDGGGVFRWIVGTPPAANNGTIRIPPGSSGGYWKRIYAGAISVRWFGAKGNNAGNDAPAINGAIDAAGAAGGGIVFIPPGIYRTTESIKITMSGITLRGVSGAGLGTWISAAGAFDIIIVNPAPSIPCGSANTLGGTVYDARIESLMINHATPTGGNGICATHVVRFSLSDMYLDSYAGMRIHNFNTVSIERTRIDTPTAGYGIWLTGGGTSDRGTSDVLDMKDVVVQGVTHFLGDVHGLIIDGAVATVSAHKLYVNNVDGVGVYIRNNIGASANPQFVTFYGLESDFPYLEAVRIENGNPSVAGPGRLYFTDTQVHGSQGRANIWIGDRVSTVSFKGGFSSGACESGFDIAGDSVSVEGVDVLSNSIGSTSQTSHCGVATGSQPGIKLRAEAERATIFGNKVGNWEDVNLQACAVEVVAGASMTSFAIVGNSFFNNKYNRVCNPGGFTPVVGQRVIANNACGTSQAGGPSGYCHYAQGSY